MTKSLVDVEVIVAVKTEKAVMVKLDELSDGVWLPLSQIEIDEADDGQSTVTLPEWLAIEKGLI